VYVKGFVYQCSSHYGDKGGNSETDDAFPEHPASIHARLRWVDFIALESALLKNAANSEWPPTVGSTQRLVRESLVRVTQHPLGRTVGFSSLALPAADVFFPKDGLGNSNPQRRQRLERSYQSGNR
jgi:hypothetical protein